MERDNDDFKPVSGAVLPRFAGVATFMRLKYLSDPAGLDIGLIGVPWDGGTTNRAGARHGPRQIRDLSTMMRNVHPTSGIKPFELCKCADLGDVSVNPIDLEDTLSRVEEFYREVHKAGVLPLTAGGDHLITLPIMRAIAKERPLGMVHIDAHSDTNDRYFGEAFYTHGTPFRRAVEEGLLDPKRTVQIGIRGGLYTASDMKWALEQGMRIITMDEFYDIGLKATIEEVHRVVGDGATYISFDVDGLDPVYAPGTGTPEIGGLTSHEGQRIIRALQGLDLVGGDVVEVAPPFDTSGNTALLGATFMWEILCVLTDAVARRRA